MNNSNIELSGYLRADGRKGIRNVIVVAYLVECAHHVARHIAAPFGDSAVHLIGFSGCYPNVYADRMMKALCTHPNVGGVLLVSLGCESFDRATLEKTVSESGRPVKTLVIQKEGGTRKTTDAGRVWITEKLEAFKNAPKVPMSISELTVGTICGGSDATSGLTANPGIGRAFDTLVDLGGTAIFEETGELIGCEDIMMSRAATPELGDALRECVNKADRYYTTMGHGSFAPGNAEGGLTTQEEKSMGAYCKSGDSTISGLIQPSERPAGPGLYLLDVVPDGEVRFGFPNINDTSEIAELIACGSHVILFSTGRGSVVGAAISPVIKVCANPETYQNMSDDMDINAGRLLEGEITMDELGSEIFERTIDVANGAASLSEELGHQEFVLTYKNFESANSINSTGPACHPSS